MSGPKEWIASLLIPGFSARRFEVLRQQGVDLPAVLAGHTPEMQLPPALTDAVREYLAGGDLYQRAELIWRQGVDNGWTLLTRDDPNYPSLLNLIADPPILLWIAGDVTALSLPQLAVVGSRKASREGCRLARSFSRDLAGHGVAITSGLAQGIDGAAHTGALDAGGRTLAVFGTGLDLIYPRVHRDLAARIVAAGGALVSEYPPGTAPLSYHFPQRNRIISGLSCGTLVVEAAMRSGSLITARQALEQGRCVFAMPGSIHNPLTRGCHALIREGATLVESSEQIISELAPVLGALIPPSSEIGDGDNQPSVTALPTDLMLAEFLQRLPFEPVSLDALAAQTQRPIGELQAQLMELELEGFVEIQGDRVVRQR